MGSSVSPLARLSIISLPPLSPLVLSLSPSAVLPKGRRRTRWQMWEGNGTRGNGAGRRRRRRRRWEEKEGHVFCFCSHYSSPAGRYPGRQCSVGWGFGRRVISGSAGGASVTFLRIAGSQKAGWRERWGGVRRAQSSPNVWQV